MSDIGILNGPMALAFMALLFGGPGIPIGAIIGALLWRGHRVIGGILGAVIGFALCLLAVMWWSGAI